MLRLEAQIVRPPTRKCREVVAVMEEAMRRFPGRVRMVTYERGAPRPERPTLGFLAYSKSTKVPKAFVGGRLVAYGEVPSLEDIVATIREQLAE